MTNKGNHLEKRNDMAQVEFELKDIKDRLRISQVLRLYNLNPDKNLRLDYPFYQDKTLSLFVQS